jgi:hypothetical protein
VSDLNVLFEFTNFLKTAVSNENNFMLTLTFLWLMVGMKRNFCQLHTLFHEIDPPLCQLHRYYYYPLSGRVGNSYTSTE